MKLHLLLIAATAAAFPLAGVARAGEAAPKTAPATDVDVSKLKPFDDPSTGFWMRIPPGYERLTQDEYREVVKGLTEFLGKEAGERALRQPPVYFKGPVDPKRPNAKPPLLNVFCSGAPLTSDAVRKDRFKEQLEQDYKKQGINHGDISVEDIQVGAANAVRAEYDVYSPIDNSRSRMITVLVPAGDRRYYIFCDFSSNQAEGAEKALGIVLKTFKVLERPVLAPEERTKWGRVALWTVGGFIVGILLSVILKMLAGMGAKPKGATSKK